MADIDLKEAARLDAIDTQKISEFQRLMASGTKKILIGFRTVYQTLDFDGKLKPQISTHGYTYNLSEWDLEIGDAPETRIYGDGTTKPIKQLQCFKKAGRKPYFFPDQVFNLCDITTMRQE